MKNDRKQNTLVFFAAIMDAFRDEDDRELNAVGTVEIPENGDLTKTITDLFYAFRAVYNNLTDAKADPLDFISILTRLVFQDSRSKCKEENHIDK